MLHLSLSLTQTTCADNTAIYRLKEKIADFYTDAGLSNSAVTGTEKMMGLIMSAGQYEWLFGGADVIGFHRLSAVAIVACGMMAIYGALGASADTERAHLHLLLTLVPQII